MPGKSRSPIIRFLKSLNISAPAAALLLLGVAMTGLFVKVVIDKQTKASGEEQLILLERPDCVEAARLVAELRAERDAIAPDAPRGSCPDEIDDLEARLLEARRRWVAECQSGLESDNYYLNMQRGHESRMAAQMAVECEEQAAQGDEAFRRQDFATALRHYSRALQLQHEINIRHPSASQAGTGKETRLRKKLDEARHEPELIPYRDLAARADKALESGQLELARTLFTELMARADALSLKIPPTVFDAPLQKRRAERKLLETGARIRAQAATLVLDKAREQAAGNNYAAAADSFSQALALLRDVQKDYPGTTPASQSNLDAVEAERQNTLATPLRLKLAADMKTLDSHLSKGQIESAVQTLNTQMLLLEDMVRLYPKNMDENDESIQRIRFLHSIRDDLPLLHRSIHSVMKPMPGSDQWLLMDREVSQLVFEKLHGSNPCQIRDDSLPVEGVTLEEARRFARLASWICGREARLPDIDSFRRALGSPDPAQVRTGTWNSQTSSDRQPRHVGSSRADANGFFDLLGNVSEWVEKVPASPGSAYCAGGNARDNPVRLTQVPSEEHEAGERVRNNGFRIMLRRN